MWEAKVKKKKSQVKYRYQKNDLHCKVFALCYFPALHTSQRRAADWGKLCTAMHAYREPACADSAGVEKVKAALTGVARLPLPAILALAEEISHQVSTRPSIMAGAGAAVVDVWRRHRGGGRSRDLCVMIKLIHSFINS